VADDFDFDEFDIEADLARAEMQLSVRLESRRYGKPVTIVEGLDADAIDLEALASDLKKQLGTGGTVEGDRVELQGDQTDRVRDLLRDEGFQVEG
jgi:translation initiation factor 1